MPSPREGEMSDQPTTPPASEAAPPPPAIPIVRIAREIPVIFSDGVKSQAFGSGISKFYLLRFDPDPEVQTPARETIIAQITMPSDAFVKMVAFFEHRLKIMVAEKAVTQESIDAARQFWIEHSGS